jgi:hypothetical protein
MATLTLYASIWAGLLIMGVLLVPSHYMGIWENMEYIRTDPIWGSLDLMVNAFTSETTVQIFGAVLLGGGVIIATANYLGGGGFSLLFVIPFVIVFAFVVTFGLPTVTVLSTTSGLPLEFQVVYTILIGFLTVLTIFTFMAGRS